MKKSALFDPYITMDPIPNEDRIIKRIKDEEGLLQLFAFNTVVTIFAYGQDSKLEAAFEECLAACRFFERVFSRTLPNSDISCISKSDSNWTEIDVHTYVILKNSLKYCEQSEGFFDITIGSATSLWDFRNQIIPDREALKAALAHVDYHKIEIAEHDGHYFARLLDPHVRLDIGGTAKGYIADELGKLLLLFDVYQFSVNLGGNVLVHGRKRNGRRWNVGLQDPRERDCIIGSVELENASAVTSGIYERSFTRDGCLYHHILNPVNGMPVSADVAGVTLIAASSMDAEGYSTTMLCLPSERRKAFLSEHPEILRCYTVDYNGNVNCV